jgi:tetratricopeptide (TPR) repeat protein
MDSVSQMFKLALQHHKGGKFQQAEVLYRRILQTDPLHVDTLHMFGLLAHHVGRNDLAIDYFQRALRVRPDFPAAYNDMGIVLRVQGKFEEAIASYHQALRLRPDFPDAHNNLGNALRDQGKADDAIASYRQALRLKPDYAAAYCNLGNALSDQGKVEEAISSYQHALRLKPDYAGAHNNLGNVLRDKGKVEEAIASYRHAIRLKPDYVEAHYNLGNALTESGKLDEAVASYQQVLRLKPNHVEALNNLGNTLTSQGKLDEAITSYQQALRLNPNVAEALNNLGNALTIQGKLEEAIASYRQALRLKPNYVNTLNFLGKALRHYGKIEEAIASYQQALSLKPDYADAHNNLGVAHTDLGRFDDAIASFREALRLQPKHAEALSRLTTLLRGKLPEADRAVIEQRLAEPDLKDSDRVKLLFGLAEVCDAKSEYAQAAALLRQASALSLSMPRQIGPGYHLDENAHFVDDLMAAFTPAFFERVHGFGLETERPVFVVGLPRSGTTLTEQILAAHSQVYGAGELSLGRSGFLALGTKPTDDSVFATLPGLPGDTFRRLAQWHLNQLENINRTAARIVDKMPKNYCFLGLLAALFPKARFIHCRRDLRDVAVSCWMTPFVRWSKEPEQIVARFRDYQRLMEHWRKVLPVSILEVQYEETVADLPAVARRLVEWCGLDWEPACLKFNEGFRPVLTPSNIQVREPVYTRSVARWRNYENEMGDLFAALKPLVDSGC